MHEFVELVFLLARCRQNEYSFVRTFLGNRRLLHHRFARRVLGFGMPFDRIRILVVVAIEPVFVKNVFGMLDLLKVGYPDEISYPMTCTKIRVWFRL